MIALAALIGFGVMLLIADTIYHRHLARKDAEKAARQNPTEIIKPNWWDVPK